MQYLWLAIHCDDRPIIPSIWVSSFDPPPALQIKAIIFDGIHPLLFLKVGEHGQHERRVEPELNRSGLADKRRRRPAPRGKFQQEVAVPLDVNCQHLPQLAAAAISISSSEETAVMPSKRRRGMIWARACVAVSVSLYRARRASTAHTERTEGTGELAGEAVSGCILCTVTNF